jgi:hypothetical protein
MLEHTQRITLELSNQCNLAPLHALCPAHHVTEKKELSTAIVHDVIQWAGKHKFQGGFAFHIYNEPMMDKRLLDFCAYVQQHCPTSKGVLIWTNGAYLKQDTLERLLLFGVHTIRVSLYTEKERDRLQELAFNNPKAPLIFSWEIQEFDNRLKKDDTSGEITGHRPCHSPLVDLTINHEGKLVLCCMDWNASVPFGDLNKSRIAEVYGAAESRMKKIRDDLIAGTRHYRMCRSCVFPRTEDPNAPIGRKL